MNFGSVTALKTNGELAALDNTTFLHMTNPAFVYVCRNSELQMKAQQVAPDHQHSAKLLLEAGSSQLDQCWRHNIDFLSLFLIYCHCYLISLLSNAFINYGPNHCFIICFDIVLSRVCAKGHAPSSPQAGDCSTCTTLH